MAYPEQEPKEEPDNKKANSETVKRRPGTLLIPLFSTAIGPTVVLLTSVGLIIVEKNHVEKLERAYQEAYEGIFGQPQFQPLDPNSLNTKTEIAAENINFATELWLFNQNTANLNGAFNEFAQRPNTENSLEIFHQIAVDHLFKGLRLLNQTTKQQVAEFLNEGPGQLQVKLDDQIYDLNNSFQFQNAFALTSLKLNNIATAAELDRETNEKRKKELLTKHFENNLDQEAILRLKDQPLKIGFTKNSILLVDPKSLARFGRTLKLVNQLGYPIPLTGIFGPDKTAGGRFVGKNELTRNHIIIDYADPHGSVDSLVHELGHYVAQSPNINPEFSQQAFNRLMDQIEAANLPHVADKNIHYYVPTDYRNSRGEQYAYFFEEFVNNGEDLRRKITEIRQEDPFAANILDVEYDFFKRLSRGKEFVRDVLTQEELQLPAEKTKPQTEKKSYQIGQIVTILDKNTSLPGILLRPDPAGPIRTDTRAVFDGDDVQILEGPFVIKKQNWDSQGRPFLEDVNWWKVRIYFQEELGRTKVGNQRGAEGWIEERWLGRIIPTEK